MRKGLICCFALFTLQISAQESLSINQVTGDNAVFSQSSVAGKDLKYEEILGSPYVDKNFTDAHVADNFIQVPIRYNAYRDEIEFKKGSQIMVLPKTPTFSKIKIINSNVNIALLETNDKFAGYFFELVNGQYSLYKKNEIKFIDETPAASSYASAKPANFKEAKPVYYIKTPGGYIKDFSQKNLAQEISGKNAQINEYFKMNKGKLNSEADLIKFVYYLNSLK